MGRTRKNAVKKQDALLDPQEVPEIPVEEQPYQLPKGWKWVRLLSSFSNHTDSKKKLPQKEYISTGTYPVIDQGKEVIGGYTENKDLLYSGPLPVVIFGDHTRCLKFIDFPFVQGADGVKVLYAKKTIIHKFLYYALRNIEMPHLGYRRHFPLFKNFMIPVPPLNIQENIIVRIESLFAKLDEAKEQAEAVLDGFETRKVAILHKAFSGELTKIWRSEHGHKREEWQNLTLNDVAKWGSGGTPSRKQPEYYAGNIAWVKTGELNNDYLYETEEHITKDAIKNSSAKIFPKETVIIAMYGATIGQCAILGIDAATNQACACGIVRQNTYNKFLFNYLISEKNNFISLGKGGAQPNISQTIIKEYPISLPSLPEQREIVRILDVLLAKEQRIEEAAEYVLEQIELMKKSILARAFRGGLTTVCHYA
ncbi:MAG: hypothetical protein HDR50_09210 [Desulfovibrio sp.]|uniref:restriction endonuclease subunit S n=1 Tax=Desulfovibrio sp. TaxID=885 RepID=UPI001A70C80A|nr:restriction endonuclease subunit S [Desulfovibrio sp.]MBD5417812.1 hypothetical protein [Desulfovibrio sp.]